MKTMSGPGPGGRASRDRAPHGGPNSRNQTAAKSLAVLLPFLSAHRPQYTSLLVPVVRIRVKTLLFIETSLS